MRIDQLTFASIAEAAGIGSNEDASASSVRKRRTLSPPTLPAADVRAHMHTARSRPARPSLAHPPRQRPRPHEQVP